MKFLPSILLAFACVADIGKAQLVITAPAPAITVAAGKALTVNNTLTLTGTDGATINLSAASVDLHAPGAIGDGTPGTGTFTTLAFVTANVNAGTFDAAYAITVHGVSDSVTDGGIKVLSNNQAGYLGIGYDGIKGSLGLRLQALGGDIEFGTASAASIKFYTSGVFQMFLTASGILQFAGTTSSFPALKRSGTTLAVRLADDSGDAPLTCGELTSNGPVAIGGGTAITSSGAGGDLGTGAFLGAWLNASGVTAIPKTSYIISGDGSTVSLASIADGGIAVAATGASGVNFDATYTIAKGGVGFAVKNSGVMYYSSTMVDDSGWTANASAGDKTQAVADYSGTGLDGTMTAALNLASAGTGDALAQDEARIKELVKKVQALEAILATNKLPNN